MPIVTWDDVTGRYGEMLKLPNANVSSVQAAYMSLGEAIVQSRLASKYAVPFSSNNTTAISMCIDMVFVQTQMSRQPDKAKAVSEMLEVQIAALLDGSAAMVNVAGTIVATIGGGAVWSNTMDYHPVFGVGAIEVMAVSSAQLIDEDTARGGAGVAQ